MRTLSSLSKTARRAADTRSPYHRMLSGVASMSGVSDSSGAGATRSEAARTSSIVFRALQASLMMTRADSRHCSHRISTQPRHVGDQNQCHVIAL